MKAFMFFTTILVIVVLAFFYLNRGTPEYNAEYCRQWDETVSSEYYSVSYFDRLVAVMRGCL